MYIKTGGVQYPCRGYQPGTETVGFVLEAVPEAPGDEVVLCGDDGFALARHMVADWARWEVRGNTLVLTNLPVPAPAPEPEPPGRRTEDALVEAVINLQYEVDQMKLNGGTL